eukprot:TRINITY_DN819_c0_g1_i19.p1 TRINITY_DN819_c0_g1~~TRINITY_DN819_c0_g1_i19.p1  ORF type:complete len:254 (+),score=112.22 TRINITY_DN819_c0_g1_i19:210-971(+)
MISKTLVLLLAFTALVSCLNDTEPEGVKHHRKPFNFSSDVQIPSLFDSHCAFKQITGAITEDDCYDVHYNNEYVLEILLPVDAAAENTKYIIPFIIDPSQLETTFSLKAQQILGMTKGSENFNILYKSVPVKRGEESVLGLNFLDETMMALDFYYREVGIHFTSANEDEYELNWPLETFKDVKSETKAGNVMKKYQKMKQKYDELLEQQKKKRKKITALLDDREMILAKLDVKMSELQAKINKKKRKRERTDL